MNLLTRTVRITALSLVLALTLVACGSDADGDLAGATISVGSKDFTENILLGNMLVIALEEAGADVEDRTNLGGTVVNRDALLAGEIDVYAEYNGTGWTVHLAQEDPSFDRTELYNLVANQDLEDNSIRWVGLSPFNNTYGFASSPAATAANDGQPFTFETMAEYLQQNPDAVACMESEFPDRPDGLVLWEEHTGYQMPQSQQVILETGVIYTETGNDNCDFGEVFTTDGRIDGLGLTLVDDPGVMIIYNVSYTFRDDTLSDADTEAITEIAEAILQDLDNATMVRLNYEVDINGREYADVAREYLESIGLA
ncbi:MAG: glycine betaine ABC transporter substrate-binding protein [Nitriliruptoraceae bacterium]